MNDPKLDQDRILAGTPDPPQAEGKSVEDLAAETLRVGLEERSWQDLLAYGSERGAASGYTEGDLPDLVKQWRRERGVSG